MVVGVCVYVEDEEQEEAGTTEWIKCAYTTRSIMWLWKTREALLVYHADVFGQTQTFFLIFGNLA